MARPRVFVSSTFYDLKHIRASLDVFIQSLGFDSILSEKGDIPYSHDVPLDESCYKEVESADIYVLIVGGRYGSPASGEEKGTLGQYESVTKREYEVALKRDIPIFILVETSVYAEYHTYRRNQGVEGITYAHVDSENVFQFLERILAQRRNNPVHTFERFSDIEGWLREQWAGLFRDYLSRHSSQRQLATLSDQVAVLQTVTETLKRYLEELMRKVVDNSATVIEAEEARIESQTLHRLWQSSNLLQYLAGATQLNPKTILEKLSESTSVMDFCSRIGSTGGGQEDPQQLFSFIANWARGPKELAALRKAIGLPPLPLREGETAQSG